MSVCWRGCECCDVGISVVVWYIGCRYWCSSVGVGNGVLVWVSVWVFAVEVLGSLRPVSFYYFVL